MAVSGDQILTAALARSAKNRPDYLATKSPELLGYLNRSLVAVFAAGARINPAYYGTQVAVVYNPAPDVQGWERPTTLELLTHILLRGISPCSVVPFGDRSWTGLPRLYRLGSVYRTLGSSGAVSGVSDPEPTEGLTFVGSRAATLLSVTSATVDTAFPDRFVQLLIDEVALYLANKDGRVEEVPELKASRDAWLALYVAHLQHDGGATYTPRHMPLPMGDVSVRPLNDLFATGTEVAA